jgi:hypothetical protein
MSELETGAVDTAIPNDTAVSTPAPEVAAPEASEGPFDDSALQAIWDKHNPTRGSDGKFQPKTPAVEGEAPPAAEIEAVQPTDQTPEPAAPAIEAPVSWTAEMKAKWSSLPPDVQAYAAQRERETAQALTRYGQQVKQFEPLAGILEQNKVVFERNGVKPEQGVQLLLQAQAMLDQDPISGIAEIARRYGVDLGSLQGAQTQAPELLALRAEISNLKQQLSETSSQVRTREERETSARREAAEAIVSDFRKANPDFDLVETEVINLIPLVRERTPGLSEKEILAKAYEEAGWLNPAIRAKRQADENAKQQAEQRKKADEAKKVSSLNVRSNSTARPAARSWDDDLSSIAAKHYGNR